LHGKEKCSPKLTSPKTLIYLFSHIPYNFTFSVWTIIAYISVSWQWNHVLSLLLPVLNTALQLD
jgi:hypothetical protein